MRDIALFLFGLLTAAIFTAFPAEAGLITKFQGKSPSCVSCHSLEAAGLKGDALASDISGAYKDFGDDGLKDFLKDIPFKLMADAYAAYPLTDADVNSVINDFKALDNKSFHIQTPKSLRNHVINGLILFIISAVLLRIFLYKKGVPNERR